MNEIVLPSAEFKFGMPPKPKVTMFPVEVNPVPVMDTLVPTGPETGDIAVMDGVIIGVQIGVGGILLVCPV